MFGGNEEDSRKSFMFTVNQRDEDTLLPIIKQWIKPGTLIVSDCWKAYSKLELQGYLHDTVNHSKEYVNANGRHTNKIEGHWRQMKVSLPTHGRRKFHYSYYLAESCGAINITMIIPFGPFWLTLNKCITPISK